MPLARPPAPRARWPLRRLWRARRPRFAPAPILTYVSSRRVAAFDPSRYFDVRFPVLIFGEALIMQATLIERAGSCPADKDIEVSVVMPCLNEALTVGTCVSKAVATLK